LVREVVRLVLEAGGRPFIGEACGSLDSKWYPGRTGELFKSRQFQDRHTELAIFVTPRLVDPLSARVKELSAHMRKRYEEAGDAVGFSLFD
jgi:hypothetical protein